eukprot:m.306633 g.306633  ORF g.306633 m.306633 type:complete len:409 (+) comp41435_c0_seq1:185-1411(+)
MTFSFQCCCFVIGLVALMGSTIEARAYYPSPEICTVLHRKCGPCQCRTASGRRACRVVEQCKMCLFGFNMKGIKSDLDVDDKKFDPCTKPEIRKRTETVCCSCSFQCENGGTRIPLKGKRSVQKSYPFCGIFLRCMCPSGFIGQRCQTKETCKTKKCLPGTVCKEDGTPVVKCVPTICPFKCPPGTECKLVSGCPPGSLCPLDRKSTWQCIQISSCKKCPPNTTCKKEDIVCVQAPCIPKIQCIPLDNCPKKCPPGTTCKLSPPPRPDCPPGGNCYAIALKWTWQCVPINLNPDPCRVCPPNTVCKKKSIVCAKAPCPVECIPTVVTDPCHLKFCKLGTVCRIQNGQAVCGFLLEKPGSCPRAPPGLVATCEVKCHGDDNCKNKEKCCNFGCQRICLQPDFHYLNPQF